MRLRRRCSSSACLGGAHARARVHRLRDCGGACRRIVRAAPRAPPHREGDTRPPLVGHPPRHASAPGVSPVAVARTVEPSARLCAVVERDPGAGARLRRASASEARGYKRQRIYDQRSHPPRHCGVPTLVCAYDCRCGRRRRRGLVDCRGGSRGSGPDRTSRPSLDHGGARPTACVPPARDAGGFSGE